MQPDAPAQSPPLTDSPLPQQLAATLRGLQIMQIVLVISLVASLLGGAAQTYLLDQLINHGGSYSGSMLSVVSGAWRIVFFGTEIAQLFALAALGGAPPLAQVRELARTALGLTVLTFLLMLASNGLSSVLGSSSELRQPLMYLGYADTLISLISKILVVEVLLRLRRYAAPGDRASAESEGLLRAGLIAAMIGQIVFGQVSHFLSYQLFGTGSSSHWAGFAMRLPLSLLVSGLWLWLVQATATFLRAVKLEAPAASSDPMAMFLAAEKLPDTSAAGYRNMLLGAVWAVGGLGLTLVTYQNAHQLGGRYVVAYGAIFAGVVQFIRGLTQLGGRRP
jgi:hypothetical protein